MRSSSLPGFDLREAVENLRETFGNRASGRPEPEHRDIRSAILVELAVEPMHGYQLIQAIEARSGGTWKPTAGAVYPTLQLLADESLVTSAQVGERKVYTLTETGKVAAAQVGEPTYTPTVGPNRDATIGLAKSSAKLARALTQFPHVANAEQSERAAAIVDEARRKLYAILAED